jgi:hypothetical protein
MFGSIASILRRFGAVFSFFIVRSSLDTDLICWLFRGRTFFLFGRELITSFSRFSSKALPFLWPILFA